MFRRAVQVFGNEGLEGLVSGVRRKLSYWRNRYLFSRHVIEKHLYGFDFRVAINNAFAKGWVEDRKDWPELGYIADHMLERDGVVIDCGANIGFTSLFFSSVVGARGVVYAVEPLAANVADIRENIGLNGKLNINIIESALGDSIGVASMLSSSNGIISFGGRGRHVNVPVNTLDSLFANVEPTFIKIDVEGFECKVLEGASSLLERRPKLAIEVHPLYHSDRVSHCEMVGRILQRLGYSFALQLGIDERIADSTSWDSEKLAAYDVFNVFAVPR